MPKPEGKFRVKRHPLCPECKYDLIATVETGRRICPECGYEFELYELRGEKRAGDWTPMEGLRNAIICLIKRSLILLPFWTGFVWLLSLVLSYMPPLVPGFRMIGIFGAFAIVLIFPGIIIGQVLSKNIVEQAGFQSILITFMVTLAACAVIYGGLAISDLLLPLQRWQAGSTFMATLAFAEGWIFKATLYDD